MGKEKEESEEEKVEAVYLNGNHPLRGRDILDSGATDSIIGVETLQELAEVYEQMGFQPESEIEVDRTVHKNCIFGNNQSSSALSLSHINTGLCGKEVNVQAHMVEGGTPFLLSSKFLYDMKATINFRTGVAVSKAISDEHIQLERSAGHHLLLPVTAFAGNGKILNNIQVNTPDDCVHELDVASASTPTTSTDGTEGGCAKEFK